MLNFRKIAVVYYYIDYTRTYYTKHTMHVHVLFALLVSTSFLQAVIAEDQCPPWFVMDNSSGFSSFPQCVCSRYLPFMIDCVQTEHTSYLKMGYCAFHISDSNDTMVATCPYVFPEHLFEGYKLRLPQSVDVLNLFICTKLNREVEKNMCGRCANGTGPSVTSIGSRCVKCSSVNILYYLLLQYLPATIIFLLVLLVRINVTSAPVAHYILFCNAVTVNYRSHTGYYTIFAFTETSHRYILRAILTLNAIWSFNPLNFVSPALCLSPQIEDIHIPYIDILAMLYPFLLLMTTYMLIELHARDFRPIVTLWKPFHRYLVRSWSPNISLVQAFANLFYITYTKLLFLVFLPFASSDFMDEKGNILSRFRVTYIDPTIPYLHHKHIHLVAFSACVLIFIVIPPVLILLVYSTRLCNRLRSHLSTRLNLALLTFVNTYQGCYKDGTNGTRDYRILSGGFLALYLLLLAVSGGVFMLVEVNVTAPAIGWQTCITIFIVLSVTVAVIRPYKSEVANHSGVCLTALCAMYFALFVNFDTAAVSEKNSIIVVSVALLSLPHIVFYGYVVYGLGKWLKESDINFKAALKVLCFRQSREQNEESTLLNHA